MKQGDVLIGIAERTAATKPYEFRTMDLPVAAQGLSTSEAIFSQLNDEFPFLWSGREVMQDFEVEQFDRLFAWLVEQFRAFPNGAGSPEQHLTKMLALAALLEYDGQLWDELVKSVPDVPEPLLLTLIEVVRQNRSEGQEILANARYRDSQAAKVLTGVASKDWKAVQWEEEQLYIFTRSPVKHQAFAALHLFCRPRMQAMFEVENDFFEIVSYIFHAPPDQSLRLAMDCSNWTFKFWALFHSVKLSARGGESYPVEWTTLLSQVASVPDEWARWLSVLNEYPGRYPQIQESLGSALGNAPSQALDAYVSSISDISDLGRAPVAAALSVFRDEASAGNRQRLWTAAFRRWEQWDFGCTNQSKAIFGVAKSVFDFAVVGYLTECLDFQARAEWDAKLQVRAAALERDWHPDPTPAMSERFKIISAYQLLAHSEAVAAGEPEWLQDTPLYRPGWEDATLYRSLKYDGEIGRSTFSSMGGR